MYTTPSGKKHSLEELSARAVHTRTPGGQHFTAFYTGQHLHHQQQQQLQQQVTAQPQPPWVQMIQQQQELMKVVSSQGQQLAQLERQQQEAQQGQAGPVAFAATPATGAEGGAGSVQTQQQVQQVQQRAGSLLQRMGPGVDPMADIHQPWISSQPAVRAVLGAANNWASRPPVDPGSQLAATLLAVMGCHEDRIVERVVERVTAAITAATPSTGGVPGVTAAAAAAAAAGATSSATVIAAQGAEQQMQQAQPAGKAAKGSNSSQSKIGFPDLSKQASLADLAVWYYMAPHKDTGKTPQQLEAAEDNYAWRGGPRHRYQRWAEYEQLLRAIEAEQDRLTDKKRSNTSNPHRVVRVDAVAAGASLDVQRQTLGLSVCEYREFINGKGKGFNKGKAREAELLAAADS
jgi:hypothetical protein